MGKINQLFLKNNHKILKEKGYEILSVLGEGSFSVVKSAKWTKNGKEVKPVKVALKIINSVTAPDTFIEKFWPREEMILSKVNHDNIIQMHEIFSEGSKIYICLELASRGNLLQYLQLKGPLPETETHKIFLQIMSAVKYLHSQNIAHRDLKCENLLISGNNEIKLTDFGFATLVNTCSKSATYCGSAAYASPEVLQGIPYKPSANDIWSCGVILFIMACNVMPFRDFHIKQLVQDQQTTDLNFPNKELLSISFCELVSRILYYNREQRFGLKEILKHKWVCCLPSNPSNSFSSETQLLSDI